LNTTEAGVLAREQKMRVRTFGAASQKNIVRIYIFSELAPIRPIFHNLYKTLLSHIDDAATCTIVLLRNKEAQYHTVRRLSDRSLWQILKQVRDDQTVSWWPKIHLEEDLISNSAAQNIVVASDEDFPNLLDLTATGVTVITVDKQAKRALAFDSDDK
jgi:hypothetical protein